MLALWVVSIDIGWILAIYGLLALAFIGTLFGAVMYGEHQKKKGYY